MHMRLTAAALQAEEAEQEARLILGLYEDLARNFAGIPVIAGRKSRIESFAGANVTYTIEGMMGDRRALQVRHAQDVYICLAFCRSWGFTRT